jgi:hypothetical protein
VEEFAMRRISFLVLITLVSLIAIGALGRTASSSAYDEATPGAMAKHPFVGTWQLDTDIDDPENAPELVIVSTDGSYLEFDAEGGIGAGTWESTGDRTANLTIWLLNSDEEGGFGGIAIVRAEGEVAEDGQSWTATYTLEFVAPDGTTTGEYGPAAAAAMRLSVEPMGSPVGSLTDLFGQFEGTPETGTPTPYPSQLRLRAPARIAAGARLVASILAVADIPCVARVQICRTYQRSVVETGP